MECAVSGCKVMNTIAASTLGDPARRGDIALNIQYDFFLKTGRIAIALSEYRFVIDLFSRIQVIGN